MIQPSLSAQGPSLLIGHVAPVVIGAMGLP